MIDKENFFDHPVKNDLKYDNIWKIPIGQGDDDTTGSLLDHNYFKDYYMMTEIDLSKQQVLDADPKAMKQINFTGNLAWDPNANTTIFSLLKKQKKQFRIFDKEPWKYCNFVLL